MEEIKIQDWILPEEAKLLLIQMNEQFGINPSVFDEHPLKIIMILIEHLCYANARNKQILEQIKTT